MNEIEVHQCLYGYQDGHRLLSSSLRLPQEAAATLLLLSDLAPGLSLPAGKGYWTGIPLQSIKSYALMYTWLAPEMSRPGCVWSHVLIVSFADMARFSDLSVLSDRVKRPDILHGFEYYSSTLSLASSIELFDISKSSQLGREKVLKVIRSLYSEPGKGRVNGFLGEFDLIIFAVWSQQWPRLRRKFSFRTALSATDSNSSKKIFDISVALDSESQRSVSAVEAEGVEQWEKVAVDDILHPHETDFRRFLWRYGSDLRMGHRRFKFLTQLYIVTRTNNLKGNDSRRILERVMRDLPNPDEGKMLKNDLVGRSKYSMLPALDFIETLAFYIATSKTEFLPELSDEAFDAIALEWEDRSDEILSIAEVASQHNTWRGERILERLAPLMKSATFLSSTENKPNLRKFFLASQPSLLDSEELVKLKGDYLLELISYIPENNEILIRRILRRILIVDDVRVAAEVMYRFQKFTVEATVAAIEKAFLRGHLDVPNAWLDELSKQHDLLFDGGFIEQSQTTSALMLYASMVGYCSPKVLHVGPNPWAESIRSARDNLVGRERKKFLCFLLELALRRPIPGSEELFELSFESTHEDLKYSNLGSDLTYELLRYLPTLSWFSNWDNCLRLRVGVVEAYVKGKLDVKSFKRLGSNKLHEQLLSTLEDLKGGAAFLKRL